MEEVEGSWVPSFMSEVETVLCVGLCSFCILNPETRLKNERIAVVVVVWKRLGYVASEVHVCAHVRVHTHNVLCKNG